ncbi:hypothetical protein [Pseudomonas veronii]
MSEFVEEKTQDLSGAALDWAVLFACNGDGPDWKLVNGVFGVIGLRDVRVGMDGIDQVETFDAYDPQSRVGVDQCRSLVSSALGNTVSVPKELLS